MRSFVDFFSRFDWWSFGSLLMSTVAVLICVTVHELSHGAMAYRLGDPTAKLMGRLTLNPLHHIDPVGFIMLLVAGVGWAKPVQVDMRNFRHPKRGMALTALAGPASNLLLALLCTGLCALIRWSITRFTPATAVLFSFLSNLALLNIGLGLFNLIPLPPLDGSKILFSLLPDRAYEFMLRNERYVMLAVILLVVTGVLQRPLSNMILGVLRVFSVTDRLFGLMIISQDLNLFLSMI